ncbi:MAG TPA: glycosyltransferase family 4 protein, partial [Candidatus Didemnitutus sp.]|nr:glycosyltransferase family 4 protein [Candidatus Didemnitutus sp.]
QAGYDVEVWAPALPAGTPEPVWPFAIRRLRVGSSHNLRSQWRMARELAAGRNDWQNSILYVPEPGPLLSMLLLQFFDNLPKTRLMLTLHGSEILKLAMRPLTRWSTRRLFARADRISVVSHHAENLLVRYFPNATGKVVVAHGALRAGFAAGSTPHQHSGSGRLVVLTVARLHPRKGQLRVIEALRALPAHLHHKVEYWIVGSHDKEGYESKLRAAARHAGFPVKFLGDIPDEKLGEIYARADIFAMTSMPHKLSVEGFGLVYLEAGAHGLPLIAHDIGGVPEAVINDTTGLLVSPDDSAALTAAFARLIEDPALRRQLGDAGRVRAAAHTWRDAALTLFGQPAPAAPV